MPRKVRLPRRLNLESKLHVCFFFFTFRLVTHQLLHSMHSRNRREKNVIINLSVIVVEVSRKRYSKCDVSSHHLMTINHAYTTSSSFFSSSSSSSSFVVASIVSLLQIWKRVFFCQFRLHYASNCTVHIHIC